MTMTNLSSLRHDRIYFLIISSQMRAACTDRHHQTLQRCLCEQTTCFLWLLHPLRKFADNTVKCFFWRYFQTCDANDNPYTFNDYFCQRMEPLQHRKKSLLRIMKFSSSSMMHYSRGYCKSFQAILKHFLSSNINRNISVTIICIEL